MVPFRPFYVYVLSTIVNEHSLLVNMADVKPIGKALFSRGRVTPRHRITVFAYRDFTGEADSILTEKSRGRAHHRAIYFIGAIQVLPSVIFWLSFVSKTKSFTGFIRANERWLCYSNRE